MNSHLVKLITLSCLIFQSGCDITFKRQQPNNKTAPVEMSQSVKTISEKNKVGNIDADIITSYYSDSANAKIRKDMITHTEISESQEKKLVVGKIIPREVQVMPLPLALERTLIPLQSHVIRVHVGTYVIFMNVKSRQILAIIKI